MHSRCRRLKRKRWGRATGYLTRTPKLKPRRYRKLKEKGSEILKRFRWQSLMRWG
jgi:hypothetical protein